MDDLVAFLDLHRGHSRTTRYECRRVSNSGEHT